MAQSNGSASAKRLTDNHSAPVSDNQNSLTAGAAGPTLLADHYLIEKNAHFNRERVPERVVHAKGGGAFGYFEVTDDVSEYTCAEFLNTASTSLRLLGHVDVRGSHFD